MQNWQRCKSSCAMSTVLGTTGQSYPLVVFFPKPLLRCGGGVQVVDLIAGGMAQSTLAQRSVSYQLMNQTRLGHSWITSSPMIEIMKFNRTNGSFAASENLKNMRETGVKRAWNGVKRRERTLFRVNAHFKKNMFFAKKKIWGNFAWFSAWGKYLQMNCNYGLYLATDCDFHWGPQVG